MAASRFARFESLELYTSEWNKFKSEDSAIQATSRIDSSTICFVTNGNRNTIIVNNEEYPSLDMLSKLEGIEWTIDATGHLKHWVDRSWSDAAATLMTSVSSDWVTRYSWATKAFAIQWTETGTSSVIKPTIVGSTAAYEDFKNLIKYGPVPCEVAKSAIMASTDGVYSGANPATLHYVNESDIHPLSRSNLKYLEDGSTLSHNDVNVEGWSNYLQMVKIPNIYVGFMEEGDEPTKTKEVWFYVGNDSAPTGMTPWFINETYQERSYIDENTGVETTLATTQIESAGKYKLFCRYNSVPLNYNSTESTGNKAFNANDISAGIQSCAGTHQGTGSWNANQLHAANKKTGKGVYEMTYWEYIIFCYIFIAYFAQGPDNSNRTRNSAGSSFNIDKYYYTGLENGSEAQARATGSYSAYVNGWCDTLCSENNGITPRSVTSTTANQCPYAFMWIENPLHGKQYIWTAGCYNYQGTVLKYLDSSYKQIPDSSGASFGEMPSYVAFAANKANRKVALSADADNTSLLYRDSDKMFGFVGTRKGWSDNSLSCIDIFAFPRRYGATESTGYGDRVYTNTNDGTVMYVGGPSDIVSYDGLFYRTFNTTAHYAYWSLRGFATLDVKSGS